MLLEFLFVQMLFLPIIYGGSDTVQLTQKMLNETKIPHDLSNITKIILNTEGGAIPDIDSNLTLHNVKHTNSLMDVYKDLGTPKNRPIVARKGAKPEEFEDIESTAVNSTYEKDHQIILDNKVNNLPIVNNNYTHLSNKTRGNSSIPGDHANVNNYEKAEKPHKPLVLVDVALSPSKHNVPSVSIPSSKPRVEGNQPGMIMPVIITILTVPLLVVFGYLALNRGREAWKNRHYKRMDFLLDGMYND